MIPGESGDGPRLVVCAPLRVEQWCLRRGPARAAVVRTGLGPDRSERAAKVLRERRARGRLDALAVAGFGGGLRSDLEPGDVVVATEVRDGSRVLEPREDVSCPLAGLLASEVRRLGLPVHTGPVLSTDHLVGGGERARLGQTGAVVADMESATLARAAGQWPVAVVRVVVDTPTNPLRSPSTIRRGRAAMRSLVRVGPALARWGAAVGAEGANRSG